MGRMAQDSAVRTGAAANDRVNGPPPVPGAGGGGGTGRGGVSTVFRGDALLEGYPGLVHGGIICALVDGAMTNCLFSAASRPSRRSCRCATSKASAPTARLKSGAGA